MCGKSGQPFYILRLFFNISLQDCSQSIIWMGKNRFYTYQLGRSRKIMRQLHSTFLTTSHHMNKLRNQQLYQGIILSALWQPKISDKTNTKPYSLQLFSRQKCMTIRINWCNFIEMILSGKSAKLASLIQKRKKALLIYQSLAFRVDNLFTKDKSIDFWTQKQLKKRI